eukprot:15456773-Alexandrium_andersonii.AAC.1
MDLFGAAHAYGMPWWGPQAATLVTPVGREGGRRTTPEPEPPATCPYPEALTVRLEQTHSGDRGEEPEG